MITLHILFHEPKMYFILPEPVIAPDPALLLPVANSSDILDVKNLCESEAVVFGPGVVCASDDDAVCDATTESMVTL